MICPAWNEPIFSDHAWATRWYAQKTFSTFSISCAFLPGRLALDFRAAGEVSDALRTKEKHYSVTSRIVDLPGVVFVRAIICTGRKVQLYAGHGFFEVQDL